MASVTGTKIPHPTHMGQLLGEGVSFSWSFGSGTVTVSSPDVDESTLMTAYEFVNGVSEDFFDSPAGGEA